MEVYSDVPVDVLGGAEFDAAFGLLSGLVDLRPADEMMPLGPNAVDTASVVLWLLAHLLTKRAADEEGGDVGRGRQASDRIGGRDVCGPQAHP